MYESSCGLCCSACSYREPCHCGGCIESKGHPFHGECPVARCTREKKLDHCGQCKAFPCELLMQYSCDPEHGDKPAGERIRKCIEWQREAASVGFSFGGINYYSAQPEVLLSFYKKIGLRVVEKPASEDEYFGAGLALGGGDVPVMWIWRAPKGSESKNNLSFSAGVNLDTIYHDVREAGIACEPPARAPWGGMEFLLTDPDGNTILFL